MKKNNIAIIPARGGSKSIPGKNIMNFCGKPLLAWSILQAKAAKMVHQVYVSSDDQKILDVAVSFGALPIIRPAEFATDTATSEQVLLHAIEEIEQSTKDEIDLVVFLQTTSPLRNPEDIDNAIETFWNAQADSLFSMSLLDDFCVWIRKENNELKGLTFDPSNRGRRQDREPLYLENGSIYLFKPEVLKRCDNRFGGKIAMYEMAAWQSYEIDRNDDVAIIEYFFKKNLLGKWSENKTETNIDAADIDLIVYDFDGIMTDNRVLTLQDGTEAVFANRADGLAVNMIKELGIKQVIISTEANPVVNVRAEKIKIPCIQGVGNKLEVLKKYLSDNNIDKNKVVFAGNDINDVDAMNYVGYSVAPADAYPEVKNIAKVVLKTKGGHGVVREFINYIKRE